MGTKKKKENRIDPAKMNDFSLLTWCVFLKINLFYVFFFFLSLEKYSRFEESRKWKSSFLKKLKKTLSK